MPLFFGASGCFCGFLQGIYICVACILLYTVISTDTGVGVSVRMRISGGIYEYMCNEYECEGLM